MNRLAFLVSFLLLNVFLFNSITQAENCKLGNTNNPDYMRRSNDDRCEGIIKTESVDNQFDIVSFVIGQLQPTKKLTIQIPKIPNLGEPTVVIQSTVKPYQLKPLKLKDTGNQWQFRWTDEVIKKANISPNTLRSIASTDNIIIPVRLSEPTTPVYDIRIYTGGRVKEITLKIQTSNGNEIYSKTLNDYPGDEVKFTWDGKNKQGDKVSAGRYTIKVDAKVERKNDTPAKWHITRQFEHNPQWLE